MDLIVEHILNILNEHVHSYVHVPNNYSQVVVILWEGLITTAV